MATGGQAEPASAALKAGGDTASSHAAVLHGADDIRFQEAPKLGAIKAGHVRIEVKAVGICGSDIHMLKEVSREMHTCINLAPQQAVPFAELSIRCFRGLFAICLWKSL